MDPSIWSAGLVTSMGALSLGGLAAVLGLWIGRDKSRPIGFAVAMTVLITSAVGVGVFQSFLDAVEMHKKKADLDNMMTMVTEIAIASGDEELAALIEAESGVTVTIPEPEPVEDTAVPTEEVPATTLEEE
ncbi:MAG: hypothetical protein GY913_24495 [Proteobacteria bacterium]|nr:hypothetical protein [Pseudomonadota bacterium]MCP4920074.1 hypothetical protein [Pseudomonadota bacterium]